MSSQYGENYRSGTGPYELRGFVVTEPIRLQKGPAFYGSDIVAVDTTVSRTGFPVDTVAMEVEVVPVPAAVWLFGSALGLPGWARSRLNA